MNFGFLMSILVCFDSLALFWNITIYGYLPKVRIKIDEFDNIFCVLFNYSARVFQLIPLLIQVFISVLQYLNVVFPFRIKKLNKFYLILTILFILIFCFLINAPSAFRNLDYIVINGSNKTITVCQAIELMSIFSLVWTAFLRCILPFFLVSITNLLTVKALITHRLSLNASITNEIKFAKTLVYLGIIFLIINFPLSCVQILIIIFQFGLDYSSSSDTMKLMFFVYDLTKILAWSYYGVGFLINLRFNKIFQKSFINKIKKIRDLM